MSTTPNDGGPAFPNNDAHGCAFPGMSLRDWFAGQIAAAGLVNASGLGDLDKARRANLFKKHAAVAYEIADALVKEGEKGPA